MERVVKEWPVSCEHFLTKHGMNRIAWLGQASMCIETGIPRFFRGGFNLMTQEGTHDGSALHGGATIAYVNHCLKRLRHELEHEKIQSLAISRLATGVGGLKWEPVQTLIRTHLGDLPIPIFVYATYHKGVAAKEPGLE